MSGSPVQKRKKGAVVADTRMIDNRTWMANGRFFHIGRVKPEEVRVHAEGPGNATTEEALKNVLFTLARFCARGSHVGLVLYAFGTLVSFARQADHNFEEDKLYVVREEKTAENPYAGFAVYREFFETSEEKIELEVSQQVRQSVEQQVQYFVETEGPPSASDAQQVEYRDIIVEAIITRIQEEALPSGIDENDAEEIGDLTEHFRTRLESDDPWFDSIERAARYVVRFDWKRLSDAASKRKKAEEEDTTGPSRADSVSIYISIICSSQTAIGCKVGRQLFYLLQDRVISRATRKHASQAYLRLHSTPENVAYYTTLKFASTGATDHHGNPEMITGNLLEQLAIDPL